MTSDMIWRLILAIALFISAMAIKYLLKENEKLRRQIPDKVNDIQNEAIA